MYKTPWSLGKIGLWFPILHSFPLPCDFAVSWVGGVDGELNILSNVTQQGPSSGPGLGHGKTSVNPTCSLKENLPAMSSLGKLGPRQPTTLWAWQYIFVVNWWDTQIVIQQINKQS